MDGINIIWTVKPQAGITTDWEVDWFRELFGKLKIRIIFDDSLETVRNRSILVVNANDYDRDRAGYGEKLKKYISLASEKGYKIAVMQIGDEYYHAPTDFYGEVEFVIRNHYTEKLNEHDNVYFLPLGYKKGFWDGCKDFLPKLAKDRKYNWSFIGQVINKPTRHMMISSAFRIPYGFAYSNAKWEDMKSMGMGDYRNVLSESVFILCPRGWENPDSFRLCEALEAGSIPVTERANGYFEGMFGPKNRMNEGFRMGYPVPSVKSWDDFPELFHSTNANLTQKRCIFWWGCYKDHLKEKIRSLVEEKLL